MFDIKEHTHYLVIAGSHSYGMARPESDIDVRGWVIPPKEYFFSFHKRFEQTEQKWTINDFPWIEELTRYIGIHGLEIQASEPIDSCIYNVQKFVKLAANCNPNIIDLLYTDEEDILHMSELGAALRRKRDLFLTARAHYTFTGYAVAQLKRINTHRRWLLNPPTGIPVRGDFGLPERTTIPADQREAAEKLIEKQVRLWLLEEAEIDATIVQTIQDDIAEAMASILAGKDFRETVRQAAAEWLGMSENFIDVLQREKRYKQAKNEWDQYQGWLKNRNPARARLEAKHGYDTKHASHLVRLLLQAEEILREGWLTIKDKARAEFLTQIRNGSMTYEEVVQFADESMKRLEKLYKSNDLAVPKKPDIEEIDDMMMSIILEDLDRSSISRDKYQAASRAISKAIAEWQRFARRCGLGWKVQGRS
jgi:predicted nucleotidyltransferase